MGVVSGMRRWAVESTVDEKRAALAAKLADRAAGKSVSDYDIRILQSSLADSERELRRMEENRLREQSEEEHRRRKREEEHERDRRRREEARSDWERDSVSTTKNEEPPAPKERKVMASPRPIEAPTLEESLEKVVKRNDVDAIDAFLKRNTDSKFSLMIAVDQVIVDAPVKKGYLASLRLLAEFASREGLGKALNIAIQNWQPDIAVHLVQVLKRRGWLDGVESPLIQLFGCWISPKIEIMFEALLPYCSLDEHVLMKFLSAIRDEEDRILRLQEYIYSNCRLLPLAARHNSILGLAVKNSKAFYIFLERLKNPAETDELAGYWLSQIEVRNGRVYNPELQIALVEAISVRQSVNKGVLKYLISECDLDAVDGDGNTPLIHAALRGEYISELIDRSDLSIRNRKGMTAYDVARKQHPKLDHLHKALKPPLKERIRSALRLGRASS
jgi:ankyrin repeat protein